MKNDSVAKNDKEMKPEATSVFTIWWRTRGPLKQKDSWNTFLPLIIGLLVFIIDLKFFISSRNVIQTTASTLLALDGGLLGFTIAGFGIFQSIPKTILNHAVGTQADGYPWSYYKLMLLNYLHVLFITFLSVCILITFYLLSFFPANDCSEIFKHLGKCFLFSGIIYVQAMVLIKLKVFLFWIYDNSLMLAMSAAKAGNEEAPETVLPPFDTRND